LSAKITQQKMTSRLLASLSDFLIDDLKPKVFWGIDMGKIQHRARWPGLIIGALVGIASGLGLTSALAQLVKQSDAPLDITSERFEATEGQNFVTWTGNVHAVQGDVILTTPKLVLYQDENGDPERVVATGGMRYSGEEAKISGKKMVYEIEADIITVTGNVVVIQGEQVMSGHKLVYNLTTGSLVFSGEGQQRVRGIFYSKDNKDKPENNTSG
jgi:lipopolysaccharide export system protein LptA